MSPRHTIRSHVETIDPTNPTAPTVRIWTATNPWGQVVERTADFEWAMYEANRKARHTAALLGLAAGRARRHGQRWGA